MPLPSQLLQSRPSPVSPMSENFLPPSSCQRPIFGRYQTGQHWKCLVYPSLPLVSKRESGSEPRLKARNVFPDCGCWLGCWEKQNRGCRVISWAAKVPHFVYRAATRCCWLQLALFYCRQQRKYKTSIMKVVIACYWHSIIWKHVEKIIRFELWTIASLRFLLFLFMVGGNWYALSLPSVFQKMKTVFIWHLLNVSFW